VQTVPRTTIQLVGGLHSRVVHRDTLQLTFTLAAQAHVELLASRRGRVVAHTRPRTLRAGRRRLLLRLDPKRWPTKLDLHATPLHPLPTAPAPTTGSGNASSGPPLAEDNVST
jgi:hypothetical protein